MRYRVNTEFYDLIAKEHRPAGSYMPVDTPPDRLDELTKKISRLSGQPFVVAEDDAQSEPVQTEEVEADADAKEQPVKPARSRKK